MDCSWRQNITVNSGIHPIIVVVYTRFSIGFSPRCPNFIIYASVMRVLCECQKVMLSEIPYVTREKGSFSPLGSIPLGVTSFSLQQFSSVLYLPFLLYFFVFSVHATHGSEIFGSTWHNFCSNPFGRAKVPLSLLLGSTLSIGEPHPPGDGKFQT